MEFNHGTTTQAPTSTTQAAPRASPASSQSSHDIPFLSLSCHVKYEALSHPLQFHHYPRFRGWRAISLARATSDPKTEFSFEAKRKILFVNASSKAGGRDAVRCFPIIALAYRMGNNMQCSKCNAASMLMRSEKPIGTIYLVRLFSCPRCGSQTKEIRAVATGSPLLLLASSMTSSAVPIR